MHPLAWLGRQAPDGAPILEIGRASESGRVVAVVLGAGGVATLVVDCTEEGAQISEILAGVRSATGNDASAIVLAPEPVTSVESLLRPGLVVFDAECPMCRATVEWLARRDRRRRLRFLPLDSGEGRRAAELAEVDPDGPGSLVFVESRGCVKESEATLGVLAALGGGWRVAAWLGGLVPRGLRDRMYRWVAARRRRLLAARSSRDA